MITLFFKRCRNWRPLNNDYFILLERKGPCQNLLCFTRVEKLEIKFVVFYGVRKVKMKYFAPDFSLILETLYKPNLASDD